MGIMGGFIQNMGVYWRFYRIYGNLLELQESVSSVGAVREKENNSSLQLLNFLCTGFCGLENRPAGVLTLMCLCQVPPVPGVP